MNQNIRDVESASRDVARVIGELPERELTAADFDAVREALTTYLEHMDGLNAAMRDLGSHVPALATHVAETFRPSAEAAAQSCQHALDALGGTDASQEDFQRAITRIGQCLERYATAVTNVKAAHDRAAP